ncbi:peptidoglycan editing factor PgeF [Sporosarcina sp. BI001-red]|uniref:peptidoglycan editing factor PgeF n=1 Tax=Sporosarcina sp. BI001-red TaxID=2282866 RepID=UPI000E23ACA6|nr:peptidoglycan editing factor PgeF [Sporosarcina sp. BI001-red]REB08063.1 peptidoglycan editing factor PgeF [Sporosarcina sp. BI001-red]
MKIKRYDIKGSAISGFTLKDSSAPEENNLALHACLNPASVLKNRKTLASSIGYSTDDFVYANQTHSANFHKVTRANRGRGATVLATAIPDTDALYTNERGIVLAGFMADCVPVLLSNEHAGIVGVIHSGWQGTVKEITSQLLKHLIEQEGCRPEDFQIVIGPALSQEKFEVDRDVYENFHALGYAEPWISFHATTGKYHIDNQRTVKTQCELAGIPSANISIDPICTFQSEDGFSYRQDKKAGRHLAFICL